MLGFIADAVTDEIPVDGIEITEANWFRYDQLPGPPAPKGIIAGRLVQQYVAEATLAFG
jgi:NAD+ diphosphatase